MIRIVRRAIGARSFVGWGGNDTGVQNGEQQGMFNTSTWGTGLARSWTPPAPCTISRLTIMLNSNNNTINGANFVSAIDEVNADQIVVVDQATGTFTDITNKDAVPVQLPLQWVYNFGDGTVGCRSAAYMVTP